MGHPVLYLQKGRDLNKPTSRKFYTTKTLSFYNVSRVRKNLMIFYQVVSVHANGFHNALIYKTVCLLGIILIKKNYLEKIL